MREKIAEFFSYLKIESLGEALRYAIFSVLVITMFGMLHDNVPMEFPLFGILKSGYVLYFYTVLSYNILYYWDQNIKNYKH